MRADGADPGCSSPDDDHEADLITDLGVATPGRSGRAVMVATELTFDSPALTAGDPLPSAACPEGRERRRHLRRPGWKGVAEPGQT